MNKQQRVVMLFALLAMTAMALGCANNTRVSRRAETPAYDAELARARASIAAAEQAEAARYGNQELTLARSKLRAAEEAAEDGDVALAVQLATEADLDADLAVAKTRNHETQELVTEVRSGLRTLEDELQRSGADSARP
jgi:hypothetical protein